VTLRADIFLVEMLGQGAVSIMNLYDPLIENTAPNDKCAERQTDFPRMGMPILALVTQTRAQDGRKKMSNTRANRHIRPHDYEAPAAGGDELAARWPL
jgi:hypothetical protein